MSHFGDLLAGKGDGSPTASASKPVVPAVTAPEPDPIAEIVVPPTPEVPPVAADIPSDLKWLSKDKLEEIGRTLGIELDRRLSQPKLVQQLEEHIANKTA
tara:strand:- start:282 stop:581 length:300 start_codon:yes stop_codon:yes gene_type:complete